MTYLLNSEAAFRFDWRRSLEEIYRGRNLSFFESSQSIPMHSHEVWVVCRGVVQLSTLHPSGDEVLVGLAFQSMPFGLPLTMLEPYQAIALSDVDLMRFTMTEIEESPELSLSIFRHLNRRLQQAESMLALVSNKRVEDRLREILLFLKKEVGQPTDGGMRLSIRLTHQHLANAISSTRVTVTRALGQLQADGWLWIDRDRHIVIAEEAV
ncbi:Crp/Fnr family transcriptional regulator [Tumidithrix elongata RA019]|uniref:Crp/Fnr family transcriptional regulator n=1 Tax=Tumidithrix elongata BACA0141 TaxID=2716417 RepID=A0AAW9Q113_9CYAN|nr:Crp/Fnr family transcriptional regulator [Tumidithrix elongata RA019]